MQELIDLNAGLTPEQILVCEYWGDNSRVPWVRFAEMLAYRRVFSLGQEIRLFRALGVALHDAMAFADAAAQAGYSRRLAGIHFLHGDLNGRTLGTKIGRNVVGLAA